MSILINVILPIFLAVGGVALAQPSLKLDTGTLSRISFHIFLPALVFESLLGADLGSSELGRFALASVVSTLALWPLGEVAARWLRLEGVTRGSFLIALLLVNSGNFGYPVVSFAFGESGLPPATIYVLVNTVFVATLGVYLAAQGKATAGMALRRLLSVPVLYASVFGLLANLGGLGVPEPVMKAVHLLSVATVPTSLAVLGLQLSQVFRGVDRDWRSLQMPALVVVLVIRLVLSPLLGLGVARWLGLQGVAHDVFVLDCALPTAVLVTILAGEFEADTSFATLSVFATTAASLVTVTVWLNWLIG